MTEEIKENIEEAEEIEALDATEARQSCMIAIPMAEAEIEDPVPIMNRLEKSEDFRVKRAAFDDERGLFELDIEYGDKSYKFYMRPTDTGALDDIELLHRINDMDLKELRKRHEGVYAVLEFSDDALESYHLQLKIIDAMFPQLLAVLDVDSTKILSGKWVHLAAGAKTPPSPKYLFSVHGVFNSDDDVWLHSHGLLRCGTKELEVLGSTKDTCDSHYAILENVATRLIEDADALGDYGDCLYVGQLGEDVHLMVTWVPWEEAVETIPDDACGGKNDRAKDDEIHTGYTGALFTFPKEEDYNNNDYKPLSVYDELMKDNPLLFMSNKETRRMSELAIERLSYMKRAFALPDTKVLVKVGLKVDEEYATETNVREHIWFLLKEVGEDSFTAELTQEPYAVSGMHEGSVGTYPYSMITDWVVYMEDGMMTPDDVYLL